MRHALLGLVLAGLTFWAGMAPAQTAEPTDETETATPAATTPRAGQRDCPPGIGCVTRRPLPRYVSLKGNESRARRGPGADHRVDWVYQRPGLPMRVTAEYENWRRVEDPEGAGGWMHYALLSSTRTAMVTTELAEMHSSPDSGGAVVARLEAGVTARILECRTDWCRLSRDGLRGWLPKTSLWGIEPGEVFD